MSPRWSSARNSADLSSCVHRVHRLGDPHGGRRPALQVDGDRVAQHVAGEREDRRRHGGAEEERLPLGGQVAEDLPDLGQKAHVEHPVRLVQHQDLEPGQPGVGLGEVIQQTAGSRDDDIHPAPEGVLLRSHADPAEHGRRRDRRVHREIVEVLHDLCGQLTGRGEDEGPGGAARLVDEAVQDRQHEGRGLAAPGHGAGEDVPAGQGGRHRVRLDRCRAREAELLHALEETGVELQ